MSKNVHTPKKRFAASMHDIKFADYAECLLKYGVSASQIAGAREVLDIPSFAAAAHMNNSSDRFGEIERRLAILEQRVEVYLKGSR